jgi:hypothetical protein
MREAVLLAFLPHVHPKPRYSVGKSKTSGQTRTCVVVDMA